MKTYLVKSLCFLILIFALIFALTERDAFSDDEVSNQYQDLFYPNGMPMIVGIDGVSRPMGYEFFFEDPLPNSNLNVILFSEIIKTGAPFENEYSNYNVCVAVVQNNATIISEANTSIKSGEADAFYSMGGVLNHFNISATIQAEHLYLWGVQAGSGQEEHGTHCIYMIDKTTNSLIPILTLEDSFFYFQAGLGEITSTKVYLYIADIDNDGKTEILTRKYIYEYNEDSNTTIDSWSDTINVYHFNDATQKYESAGQLNTLPANAKINRED